MRKRVSMIALAGALAAFTASPVAASGAKVDRLEDFESILAVAMPDDFPIGSLMRAHCPRLLRVEHPDGSSTEIQDCQLSDEPVLIPENQGVLPSSAFVFEGGSCMWFSDYWGNTEGIDVYAASFHYTVTPSGHVHVKSDYPSQPLACE